MGSNETPLVLADYGGASCCGKGIIDDNDDASRGSAGSEFKQTEDFLAAEMNKLSFQERNKALEDIHCVGEGLKEDPEVVELHLQEFQKEVEILRPETPVYQAAEAINADYVNDRGFRLRFLRAKLYDVKKAVNQMMKFLQCKEKYFGKEKLCKEIDLSDLTEEDREYMRKGPFHVPKHRDRSGRVILHMLNTRLRLGTAQNLIRVSFYVFWNLLTALEDVQLKGVVSIFYDIQKPGEQSEPFAFKEAIEIMSMALTLPFRYSSRLWCLKPRKKSSLLNNSILAVSTKFFSSYIRVRTRLNYGSDLELQYYLQSLGIPTDEDFPVDTGGNIRQGVIDRWLQGEWDKCKKAPEPPATNPTTIKAVNNVTAAVPNKEETDDMTIDVINNNLPNMRVLPVMGKILGPPMFQPAIIQPWPSDVLFGRGVGCQNHPGNVRFREIMDGYKEQYDNFPRSKRRIVMANLREGLKSSGTRFLRMNKGGYWEECNAAEVDTKIGQYFRSLRKFKKESLKSA
ncbi:unnamed protein product [Cylindrotheca closterium]|uniref:DUF6824 domain-containing protein n=1 Tax=Cylindrotheca closterium TaxID=2856 RepID=A0AAD2FL28_9STRA|nr:unnamed protein product [Cylindrotheca closterium]